MKRADGKVASPSVTRQCQSGRYTRIVSRRDAATVVFYLHRKPSYSVFGPGMNLEVKTKAITHPQIWNELGADHYLDGPIRQEITESSDQEWPDGIRLRSLGTSPPQRRWRVPGIDHEFGSLVYPHTCWQLASGRLGLSASP